MQVNVGEFEEEEAAARAYDRYVLSIRAAGMNANVRTNFPPDQYGEEELLVLPQHPTTPQEQPQTGAQCLSQQQGQLGSKAAVMPYMAGQQQQVQPFVQPDGSTLGSRHASVGSYGIMPAAADAGSAGMAGQHQAYQQQQVAAADPAAAAATAAAAHYHQLQLQQHAMLYHQQQQQHDPSLMYSLLYEQAAAYPTAPPAAPAAPVSPSSQLQHQQQPSLPASPPARTASAAGASPTQHQTQYLRKQRVSRTAGGSMRQAAAAAAAAAQQQLLQQQRVLHDAAANAPHAAGLLATPGASGAYGMAQAQDNSQSSHHHVLLAAAAAAGALTQNPPTPHAQPQQQHTLAPSGAGMYPLAGAGAGASTAYYQQYVPQLHGQDNLAAYYPQHQSQDAGESLPVHPAQCQCTACR